MATIHDILKNESEFREQQAANIRFMQIAFDRIREALGMEEGQLFLAYASGVEDAVQERDALRAEKSALQVSRDALETEMEAYRVSEATLSGHLAAAQQTVRELRAEVDRLKDERIPTCASPEMHESIPAAPGVEHYTHTLARQPDVLARLHWVLNQLPRQTKSLEVSVPVSLLQEAVGAIEGLEPEAKWMLAEMERLQVRDLEWQAVLPGCCHPDDLAGAVAELRETVGLPRECNCCDGPRCARANPNRAKLQAVYDAACDAQLKHIEAGYVATPDLLEQLQSLYRLLEDPA